MCVTTEVPGKLSLRGGPRLDHTLNTDGSSQYLPRQSRNVTYVSRLQCVQAGIESQLSHLAKEEPNSTVALVTFSNDVTIVGDGESEAQVISGKRLEDQEDLMKFGQDYVLEKKIGETHKKLSNKLFDLQEQGPTALGPAVVTAIGLASQKPRSRIIVCTDGLANVGLGSIDSKLESQAAMKFYENIGELAKEKGVSVSVIGIEGSDCFMECIGKLADITGGYMNIVNPLNITTDFANILSDPLVATNVSIKLILHRGLRFEDDEDSTGSRLEKSIGNVTRSTEFTFNYSVDKENAELKEQKQLPFQIQVHFTKPDGTKCMRVITRVQAATTERQAAEAAVAPSIVGLHNIRTAAKFASAGLYEQARAVTVSGQKMAQRGYSHRTPVERQQEEAEFRNVIEANAVLDRQIFSLQRAESNQPSPAYTASPFIMSPSAAVSSEANFQRQVARDDASSNSFLRMKKASRKQAFASPAPAPPQPPSGDE